MSTVARDPITEGWFVRGTPLDHQRRFNGSCPVCKRDTPQDEYVAILGKFGGMGAPVFAQPFLKKRSTKGKVGSRSRWFSCSECGSLLPGDDEARKLAQAQGGDLFTHSQAIQRPARSPGRDPARDGFWFLLASALPDDMLKQELFRDYAGEESLLEEFIAFAAGQMAQGVVGEDSGFAAMEDALRGMAASRPEAQRAVDYVIAVHIRDAAAAARVLAEGPIGPTLVTLAVVLNGVLCESLASKLGQSVNPETPLIFYIERNEGISVQRLASLDTSLNNAPSPNSQPAADASLRPAASGADSATLPREDSTEDVQPAADATVYRWEAHPSTSDASSNPAGTETTDVRDVPPPANIDDVAALDFSAASTLGELFDEPAEFPASLGHVSESKTASMVPAVEASNESPSTLSDEARATAPTGPEAPVASAAPDRAALAQPDSGVLTGPALTAKVPETNDQWSEPATAQSSLIPAPPPPDEVRPLQSQSSSGSAGTPSAPEPNTIASHETPLSQNPPLPQPSGLRVWPVLASVLGVAVLVLSLWFVTMHREKDPAAPATSAAPWSAQANREIPAPTGLKGSINQEGVRTYTDVDSGFTMSLPDSWRLVPRSKWTKGALVVATDTNPSYPLAGNAARPLVLVASYSYPDGVAQAKYFGAVRQSFAGQAITVGMVRMSRHLVPAGTAFVVQMTQEVRGVGPTRYVVFYVVHRGRIYQTAFTVPAKRAPQYQTEFSHIAKSISFG